MWNRYGGRGTWSQRTQTQHKQARKSKESNNIQYCRKIDKVREFFSKFNKIYDKVNEEEKYASFFSCEEYLDIHYHSIIFYMKIYWKIKCNRKIKSKGQNTRMGITNKDWLTENTYTKNCWLQKINWIKIFKNKSHVSLTRGEKKTARPMK